eukprot:COSAG02_NODE_28604_length_586_cov_1.110883_2_plen_98_part_00
MTPLAKVPKDLRSQSQDALKPVTRTTTVLPASFRRLRRVEESLLRLIATVDASGEFLPEAHVRTQELEQRMRIKKATSLLSRLFGEARNSSIGIGAA